MAYRGSIAGRSKSFYQQQRRFSPSFSHISSSDREELPAKSGGRNAGICSDFLINRKYASNSLLSGNVSRLMRSKVPAGYGMIFHRNMSKVSLDIEDPAEDLNSMIGGVVGDKAVEVAPVVNEVAVAAADSFAPVAAYQYLIDNVHSYTGFEWWGAIAAVTVLLRCIEVPFLIYQLKFPATLLVQNLCTLAKSISNNRVREEDAPHIEKAFTSIPKLLKQQLFRQGINDLNKLLFFFAILNMAEKVPSFTTGGTLWFTDLTTPNRMYLPILLAFTYCIRLKLDPRPRSRGVVPCWRTSMFLPALAFVGTVIAGFPTAIYYYAIPSNLFSIAFGIVMKDPRVHKPLGLCLARKPSSIVKKMG